jgi:uncharacterized membrane protein
MEWAAFFDIVRIFAFIFSCAGAVLIVYGGLRAVAKVLLREVGKRPIPYNTIRREFTSKIVFGLEFFIAADILTTLIAPTQEELILLAVVVVIRTVLGYFLEKETQEFSLDA